MSQIFFFQCSSRIHTSYAANSHISSLTYINKMDFIT